MRPLDFSPLYRSAVGFDNLMSLLDAAQNPVAQRQPGIDPRRRLSDHARAQHQPVGDNLRLFRVFFQDRQKITRQSHQLARQIWCSGPRNRHPSWRRRLASQCTFSPGHGR